MTEMSALGLYHQHETLEELQAKANLLDQNPAAVCPASLGHRSRRTMRGDLNTIAGGISCAHYAENLRGKKAPIQSYCSV